MPITFEIAYGLRGYFALIRDAETGEPIQTGIGSYVFPTDAAREAAEWAEGDGFLEEAKRIRKEHGLDESQ